MFLIKRIVELKLKKYKKKIYVWSSDRSNFTGEGNLSRKFISKLKKIIKLILFKI